MPIHGTLGAITGSVGNAQGDLLIGNDLYVTNDLHVSGSVHADLAVDNDLYVLDDLHVSGSLHLGAGAEVTTVLDEDNMSTDSNTALATQQSVKAYVDASTPATLGDIGNVNVGGLAGGNTLVYDAGQSRWENKTITGTANEVEVTADNTGVQIGLPNSVSLIGNLTIGDDTDTDRKITFGHTTLKTVIGIDDNVDKFAINTDGAFESGNDFEIDTAGNVSINNGDLFVNGGDIYGPSGAQLRIRSDAHVVVQLDEDNDGTNKFVIWDQGENSKFEVDESGNVQMDGSVTIGSNTIKASDGGTAITLDTSDNVTIGNNLILGNNRIHNSDNELAIELDAEQNVRIIGDLTIEGTTTTVDTINLLVKDKNIVINDGGGASSAAGAGLDIEENGAISGYIRVADDDRGNWDLKAPDGSELKIDVNANKTITVAGSLNIEADSNINQDVTTDANVTFSTVRLNGNNILDAGGNIVLSFDGSGNIDDLGTITQDVVIGGSIPSLTLGDGGNEDIKLLFNGDTNDYHIGYDATDDVLKIGSASTLGASNKTAVHITSGSFVGAPMGSKWGTAVHVAGGMVSTDSHWIRVAKCPTWGGSYAAHSAIFMISLQPYGISSNESDDYFIVRVRYTRDGSSGPDADMTDVVVEQFNSGHHSDAHIQANHFVLTHDGTSGNGAELWVQAGSNEHQYTQVFCSVLHSHATFDHYQVRNNHNVDGWEIQSGQSWEVSMDSMGTDVTGQRPKKHYQALSVEGSLLVSGSLELGAGAIKVATILDEDAMGSNSASALATQQSIKAYVDAEVDSHVASIPAQDLVVPASITHDSDTDTHITFGTNTQIYTCGNAERLRLNSVGVGIMGAAPIAGLAVTGDVVASDKIVSSRMGFAGTYDSAEVQGVWSMGDAFEIDTGADDFGTLYGIGYGYSTNGGLPFNNTHQIAFCYNGSITSVIGLNTGNAKFNGDVEVGGNLTIAADIIHSGDTNNKISFGTDTQSFQTAGTERLYIHSDGDIEGTHWHQNFLLRMLKPAGVGVDAAALFPEGLQYYFGNIQTTPAADNWASSFNDVDWNSTWHTDDLGFASVIIPFDLELQGIKWMTVSEYAPKQNGSGVTVDSGMRIYWHKSTQDATNDETDWNYSYQGYFPCGTEISGGAVPGRVVTMDITGEAGRTYSAGDKLALSFLWDADNTSLWYHYDQDDTNSYDATQQYLYAKVMLIGRKTGGDGVKGR